MKQLGTLRDITQRIEQSRAACAAAGEPFHADALAATLGVSYDTLVRYAAGKGVLAKTLQAAIQECHASVIGYALRADPKSHSFWMFYLRNRVGFSEKGEARASVPEAPVAFVGEERI